MPQYNVTLEDISPLITYSPPGAWGDSNTSDSLHAQYSGDSFHATPTPGATAQFTFNGTAVYLFGARRLNHGHFTITIDGVVEPSLGNGYSPTELFNTTLYSRNNLLPGQHTIILTNKPDNDVLTFLDLDYITYTAGNGKDTPITETQVDDDDTSIRYTPVSQWETGCDGLAPGTCHLSTVGDASVQFTFNGDAIEVYGSPSPAGGAYTVILDGQKPLSYNASATAPRPSTPLFLADSIGPGEHTLTLTNTQPGSKLVFDRYVARGYSPKKISTPAVVGGVCGGVVFLIWVIAAIIFFTRRQRRNRQMKQEVDESVITNPKPYMVQGNELEGGTYAPTFQRANTFDSQTAFTSEYGSAYPGRRGPGVPSESAYTGYSDGVDGHSNYGSEAPMRPRPTLRTNGVSQPSSSSQWTGSPTDDQSLTSPSNTSRYTPSSSAPSRSATQYSRRTEHTTPAAANYVPPLPPKGALPRLPESAFTPVPTGISSAELTNQRLMVPHRPQDWGPVQATPEEPEEVNLPPNYVQATQPFTQARV